MYGAISRGSPHSFSWGGGVTWRAPGVQAQVGQRAAVGPVVGVGHIQAPQEAAHVLEVQPGVAHRVGI